jgi:hypothetical protein
MDANRLNTSEIDKREVCPVHGWVGRRSFQHDRHDLCEAPEGSALDDVEPEEEDSDESSDAADDAETDNDDVPNEEVPLDEEPAPSGRSSARRCGVPSKQTLAVRRITRLELATGRAELKALGADAPYERPHTRGDCADVPRPCPYVACKYSLYLDVSTTGSIILNFPHLEPGQMPADRSCTLDLAERGAMTLEDIAVVTNLTRERIRQIELKALSRRARPAAVSLGLGPEDNGSSAASPHSQVKKS